MDFAAEGEEDATSASVVMMMAIDMTLVMMVMTELGKDMVNKNGKNSYKMC